jgi:hypothetical protein
MTNTAATKIAAIRRRAAEATAFRSSDSPPAYDWRDSLLRELHRECPAATSAELAAAEAWIRRCCGC